MVTAILALETASFYINDGHVWIDALEKRNLMAHTYNEQIADEAEQLIRNNYYQMLHDFYVYLEELQ